MLSTLEVETPTQKKPTTTNGTPDKADKILAEKLDGYIKEAKAIGTPDNPLVFRRVKYTPALARAILEKRNHNNRKASKPKIAEFAEYMREGMFNEDTPQGIAFDSEGTLVDGQNRLAAIAAADVTLNLYTTFNNAPDIMSYLDAGKNRSATEEVNRQLGINYGESVIRFHKILRLVRNARKTGKPLNFDAKTTSMSRQNAIDAGIGDHPTYEALRAEAPYPRVKLRGLPPSMFYALYAILRTKDKVAAKEFMAALAQEPGTVRPAQIATLIERGAALVRAGVRSYPLQTEMVYHTFAAWNSFRSGQNRAPRYVDATKLRSTPLPELR